MVYKSEITHFGDIALDFLGDNMLILFNEGAPPELAELAVCHKKANLSREIRVGDKFSLGDNEYEVIDIGWEANDTFKMLGHCSLIFKDSGVADLPGQIVLKGESLPNLKIGDIIKIY